VIAEALALGLVTSLHCAVMCGPLAAASCARGGSARYLAGRLGSYAAIGAVLGAVGEHALCVLPVASVQIAALAAVALAAFGRAVRLLRPARPVTLGKRPRIVARLFRILPRDPLAVGLATALLPCGALVPAWALAMAAGGALAGGVAMLAFAVASTPGLVAALCGRRLAARFRAPRLEAAAWLALAVWLAVRPLLMAARACH
jgi:sulfite exporter TauE/SafE